MGTDHLLVAFTHLVSGKVNAVVDVNGLFATVIAENALGLSGFVGLAFLYDT